MKLKLLAAAICGACLTAPTLAQSSITIYGIADAGIQASNFGNGTQYNLASGIADGSRLGFKGQEDLGGGYKAIFTLESRFEIDTGGLGNRYLSSTVGTGLTRGLPAAVAPTVASSVQALAGVNTGGALFDRQSFVGLISPFGAILVGRQYTPGFEVHAMADTFESGTAASWGGITMGIGGLLTPGIANRANNAVQYRIQTLNGFGGSLMYGVEETGSAGRAKHFRGASVKYIANGVALGLAYNSEDDGAGRDSLTTVTAGGSYTTGNLKLFAGYHNMKTDNSFLVPSVTPVLGAAAAAVIGSNATIKGDIYTLGAHYHVGTGRVMGAISRLNDKKATNADATLIGIGYNHNLSKRTDLYAILAHVSNNNGAQYAMGGAGYSGGFTSAAGQDGKALQLGVRHKF